MEFEQVVKGIIKYIRSVMIPTLTPKQQVVAHVAVSRLERLSLKAKQKLFDNFFAKTLQIVTDDNKIDLDGLMHDVKEAFIAIGPVSIEPPILGKFTFNTGDVDVLHKYIREA